MAILIWICLLGLIQTLCKGKDKMQNKDFIRLEDLKLLPQTHDFFDNRVSKSIPVFIITVIIMCSTFLIWASFARMDDVVKANAVLRPTENISELKCLVNGEISLKNYTQNQKVKKGDLLVSVDYTSEQLELETIENQLIRYESELLDYRNLLKFIQNNTSPQSPTEHLQNKIESYVSEYNKLDLQVKDIQNKYGAEKSMPESMRLPQKIMELKNQLEQAEFSFSNWKNNQLLQINENINSYDEKIQTIKLRRTVLQRNIKNANLYAPIDGSIDEILALNMGDYVVGGTNILRIIPNENEHLKAEIILDASKIARLKNGQIVNLRFPGLPPSSFGQLQGTISLIPADITVSSNNPVFLVEADIPEPFLFANNGEKINLRSGLSAEARIIVSRDSVMKMILRKLDFVN